MTKIVLVLFMLAGDGSVKAEAVAEYTDVDTCITTLVKLIEADDTVQGLCVGTLFPADKPA